MAFLRRCASPKTAPPVRVNVRAVDGTSVAGVVLNQSSADMQVLGDDRRLHLLRKSGGQLRRVTSEVDWPTYHGNLSGNRFTNLDQIHKGNVARLAPRWTYSLEPPVCRARPSWWTASCTSPPATSATPSTRAAAG